MSSVMDHGADAATLVEGIDAGDIDPESVDVRPFVEDDDKVLTPELAQRLPDEKVEEYNDLAKEEHFSELREESRLDSEQEAALDALRPERDSQETVTLANTDVEVAVRTSTNREIENLMETIAAEREQTNPSLSNVREDMIDLLTLVILDDQYSTRELWEEYAVEYGLPNLMANVYAVTEPIHSRMEAMSKQRGFRADG